MKTARKMPTVSNLRSWRVIISATKVNASARSKRRIARGAEAVANDDQRSRLLIRERL